MTLYTKIAEGRPFINLKSIRYGLIAGSTFLLLTGVFYYLYGWECLYESLLYHLIRKDHRHNFSIQFMYIYLHFFEISPLVAVIFFLPSILFIILFSFKYRRDFIFACFLSTFVFVAFNKSKL